MSPAGLLVRIGRADDIPYLEGRSVAVDGRRVAVFHTEHGFRALDNACPHLGGPLADGLLSDRCVTCPLHGRRIDLDSGEVLNDEGSVAVHEVVERDGDLYLRLAARAVASTRG